MDALFVFVILSIALAVLTAVWYVMGVYPFKMNPICKVCGRQVFGWQFKVDTHHLHCKGFADSQDDLIMLYETQIAQLKDRIKSLEPIPGGESLQYPSEIQITMKRVKNDNNNSRIRSRRGSPAKRK